MKGNIKVQQSCFGDSKPSTLGGYSSSNTTVDANFGKSKLPAIIGGSVGGGLGLILIIILFALVFKKKK